MSNVIYINLTAMGFYLDSIFFSIFLLNLKTKIEHFCDAYIHLKCRVVISEFLYDIFVNKTYRKIQNNNKA